METTNSPGLGGQFSKMNAGLHSYKDRIHINPANKGKFTATKKATGKSTEQLLRSSHPITRKRANFARMAKRHFKPV